MSGQWSKRERDADRDRRRAQEQEHRSWYSLARWKAQPHGLRWRVLLRDAFTCQMCGIVSRHPRASDMVADHKIPHRGDATLFWDENNLQCLCDSCHGSAKQQQERGTRMMRSDGWKP